MFYSTGPWSVQKLTGNKLKVVLAKCLNSRLWWGGTVVECVAHFPKIQGLNPTALGKVAGCIVSWLISLESNVMKHFKSVFYKFS